MHDNKSMVHLSVEAERCSSRVANPAEPAKRRGKINRAVPPAGARAPRSAANCGRGMKPIQDRASWLAQTLPGSNRQKQGLSRNFLRKPAEGFLRLPPAFGETSSQAGILPEEMWVERSGGACGAEAKQSGRTLPEEMWVERASGPDGDPGEPQGG